MAEHVILRYVRTSFDRMGPWSPVDSTWKTTASPEMVVHDLLHHLPDDTGSFLQEVIALGAQWYVTDQPLNQSCVTISSVIQRNYERNISDLVLNALDSKEPNAFHLHPVNEDKLSDVERTFFRQIAEVAVGTILRGIHPGAKMAGEHALSDDFVPGFLAAVSKGVSKARARFPQQKAIRDAARNFIYELADIDESKVPVGHEIQVILLDGKLLVQYADADEQLLKETGAHLAYAMPWCSLEEGYPIRSYSLHRDELAYHAHEETVFTNQLEGLAQAEQRIPAGSSDCLIPVYIQTGSLWHELQMNNGIDVVPEIVQTAQLSPRGVCLL